MFVRKSQFGFTLVEMIGVLAVIAILASVAAPRIIDSIEDAKVSKYIQQVKMLESAVAKFYADTGRWPNYTSTSNAVHDNQLMVNAINSSGDKIPGWQGPYVTKMPSSPFNKTSYTAVARTSDSNWTCDLDEDGTPDGGEFVIYRTDNIGLKNSEKISHIFDEDGGSEDWKTKGRVKLYKGTDSNRLAICFTRT